MDKQLVQNALEAAKWKFAHTMKWCPHWWTHRETWSDDKLFCDIVLFIREHGKKEKFYTKDRIYYYCGDYKYWSMGNPVSYTDKTKTFILNRAKINK